MRRLLRPPNFAALALLACFFALSYIDIAVCAATTYDDDPVSLRAIGRAIVLPDWSGMSRELAHGRWVGSLVICGSAFLPVLLFVAVTNRRVRDGCVLVAVIVFPAICLTESVVYLNKLILDGPRDLFAAIIGQADGELWSDGAVLIGSMGVWIYVWLLVILPLELIDRRRRRTDSPDEDMLS